MEYGSVIWGGAAECHVKRLECVQFKFLTWLSARCRTGVPLRYDELLRHFRLSTLLGRRRQHDLMFLRNVHCNAVDSPYLLTRLPLAVPSRLLRNHALFHVPRGRVTTVKEGLFGRIPRLCNAFLQACPAADMWHQSVAEWKRQVVAYCFNASRVTV